MKILVLSDSHGYYEYMYRAIAEEKPDYLIHLGDHCADVRSLVSQYPTLPISYVRGNCDYGDFSASDVREAVYDGVRVMSVHGHTYGVKSGLLRLYMAAKERAVHVALFGHTHCAYCEKKDNIWLMNPGSCGANSFGNYGVIEIADHQAVCSIRSLNERKNEI